MVSARGSLGMISRAPCFSLSPLPFLSFSKSLRKREKSVGVLADEHLSQNAYIASVSKKK